MGKHFRPAKEFKKKGMTVGIRPFISRSENDDAAKTDYGFKAMDSAIRELKSRMINEGMVKELRNREYYQSKGQKRRKAKAEGIMRYKAKMRERMQEDGY